LAAAQAAVNRTAAAIIDSLRIKTPRMAAIGTGRRRAQRAKASASVEPA
jgi:hypothetical protein